VALIADETLRLEDGRLLAWAEWGDPRGRPLVFLHCSPGSRLFCPDEAATAAEGVRLITVDRPGYGGSDPSPDPTLLAFGRDVARLIDHLWLGQVCLVGWSGGGQYAAAGAALLGDRVSTLGLVATPAPDDQVPWLPADARPLADLARLDPGRALLAATQAGRPFAAAPERAGDGWDSPADAVVRGQVGVEDALVGMWREAFRSGPQGFAADLVAGTRPWGFQPSDITAPAALFYGAHDTRVATSHARWWGRQLSRAQLTVVSRAGHLVPLIAWSDMLRAMMP
jgi:pimeloyl-ACP methyl ester carboxylesterase